MGGVGSAARGDVTITAEEVRGHLGELWDERTARIFDVEAAESGSGSQYSRVSGPERRVRIHRSWQRPPPEIFSAGVGSLSNAPRVWCHTRGREPSTKREGRGRTSHP